MSFLPDFEVDIFISYSHIDDQPLTEGQKGWIANFHRALQIRLAQLLGAEPKVYRQAEPHCAGHDELRLTGRIPKIGVLVSVVSPPYVNSESCLREIREFYKIAEQTGGVRIDDKPRIFKVVKTPVASEKQPQEIQGLIDYDFYQIEKPTGYPREFDPEVDPSARQNYWLKLDDLAHDIHQSLEKLKNGKNGHASTASLSPTPKQVFVSHASVDRQSAETVCRLLEEQGIGCWIAPRDVRPLFNYAGEITDAIDDAAALILVLSKRSNESSNVANEVEWAASRGKPVCTIRIEDVRPSKSLAFHINTRQFVEAWPPPLETKVTLLADTIKKLIGLPDAGASRQETAVYLAETTFDLKDERDCIRRDLQQRGYNVLPDKSLPSNAADFKKAVQGYLLRSRLSVHFIGENYGDIPRGETRSLVHLQNELAAQRSGEPGFSRLIWMPPELQVQDQRQREFIEYLRYDLSAHQGAELLETSLEELKTIIEDTLTSRNQTQLPPPPGSPMHVYLICDQEDIASASPIRDYLYDQHYEAILPAMSGDEAQIREDHKESLLLCDGCLIYYGAANEFWLRAKLRDLQKIAGYGRLKRMLAKAVYVSAPETVDKDNFKTLDALVIRNFDAFNPDSLRPFLAQLAATESAKGAQL